MFELDEFLDHFDKVRQRTRRVAACMPADQVEWTYKAGAFSIGDLVRHLGVAERYLWAETVYHRTPMYTTHGRELADGRDAVLAFLDRMHEESMALFRALTPEALAAEVRRWVALDSVRDIAVAASLAMGIRALLLPLR